MKKIIGTMLAGCLGFAFTPMLPVPSPTSPVDTQAKKKNGENNGLPEREFIFRDSAEAPLPPGAEKVETMKSKDGPRTLPNYKYENPVVLTNMPYDQDQKNQPSYVKK